MLYHILLQFSEYLQRKGLMHFKVQHFAIFVILLFKDLFIAMLVGLYVKDCFHYLTRSFPNLFVVWPRLISSII